MHTDCAMMEKVIVPSEYCQGHKSVIILWSPAHSHVGMLLTAFLCVQWVLATTQPKGMLLLHPGVPQCDKCSIHMACCCMKGVLALIHVHLAQHHT
jgi:hypothetical protein